MFSKFSENDKISARQIKRLMIFELFGVGSLVLPAQLAGLNGCAGLWVLVGAFLLAIVFFYILAGCAGQMQGDYFDYLTDIWGRGLARVFYAVYAVINVGVCIYVLELLTDLMCMSLLRQEDYAVVFGLLLLLGFYGAVDGIEARARIYELLFWLLVIPLGIMLALCVRQVQTVRWFPLWQISDLPAVRTEAGVFAVFLPVSYLVFVAPYAKDRQQACSAVKKALVWVGLAFVLLFMLLLGVFGSNGLSEERYAIITLLSMVKLPGEFLKRLDAVMAAVWFFTLYALMTSSLYYGAAIGRQVFAGRSKKKHGCACLFAALLVALAELALHNKPGLRGLAADCFYRIGLPFLILVPLLSLLSRWYKPGRGRQAAAGLFALALGLVMSGCSGTELENKSFPLAVLLKGQEQGCKVYYLFQNLSEISNERASGENAVMTDVEGETYYAAQKAYEKNNRCKLDASHTKALILDMDFFEDEALLSSFLQTVRVEDTYARNTLFYLTDSDMADMAGLNEEMEVPLGTYLEQMTENEQDIGEGAVFTLGTLMNELANQDRTVLIPILEAGNGLPVVASYALMQEGRYAGRIDTGSAMMHYLVQGQLDELDLMLEGGGQVRLTGLSCKRSLKLDGDGRVTETLKVGGQYERLSGSFDTEEIEQSLKRQLTDSWQQCMADNHADLTDSYRYLAMKAPDAYARYRLDPEGYRAQLQLLAEVEIR